MKAIVFAFHDIGCIGIRELLACGFEIQAVFTHVNDPQENIFFESVAQLCADEDIPVYAPDDVNHPIWIDRIRNHDPDFIFSFYYRHLLKQTLLDIPRLGAYNLHGSLLPRYRGRSPLNWVLVHGETETGVTLHRMISQCDAGPIVSQMGVQISDVDTAPSLHRKVCDAAKRLLAEQLPHMMRGNISLTPQDEEHASYFGRRVPADGEINWHQSANVIHNLVRAVTWPYPGAFTFSRDRKLLIWSALALPSSSYDRSLPGTVLSTSPLHVACAEGVLEIRTGQSEKGLPVSGSQLAKDLGLTASLVLGSKASGSISHLRRKRVLILGVNGFIGNHLTERLLESDRYDVYGLDINSDSISRFFGHPHFHFIEGDIAIHTEWLEYHIKKCDVVLPLVAIATPIEYTRNPLRVFELDFEENLKIVRYCVKYRKRIVFPSTSEVYGMCDDDVFDEDNSRLIVGPINKQRWIYSASKQLLDRVIWAYGQKDGLRFTLFRPFNWLGQRLDTLESARIGSSRVITQFIVNLVDGKPINLIDGGTQKRCFTDIRDGINALMAIIENTNDKCDGQIINIGNPENEYSIRDIASILVDKFEAHLLRAHFPVFAGFNNLESRAYYGEGYQDVSYRRPSIKNAQRLLGWNPSVSIETSIETTLDFFLRSLFDPE